MYEQENIEQNKQYKYNKKILKSTNFLINHYTNKHCKTLVVRCDIRYPSDYDKNTDTNDDISRCMRKVRQKYHRQQLDPHFIWVRESEASSHPHFHVAMFFDGNKVRSYNHVFKTVEEMFKNTIEVDSQGLVNDCMTSKNGKQHENGILLDRNKDNYPERLRQVHNQLSYLAKQHGKGEYADGMRDFGMSRIPKTI